MQNNTIFFCSICNVSSGSCNEDCSFCTQSVKHKADIQRYKYKDISQIVNEAKKARSHGATGFCLVTSGKGLDDKKVAFISEATKAVKKEIEEFNVIACNGTASLEQLKALKKAGVDSYNHNLETAEDYYHTICTTHTWQERFDTCKAVKEAGLNLVSGGIFGLGESVEQRTSFINSLKQLNPKTVPLNFYHPNPALPLKAEPLDIDEALELIKWVRAELPNVKLMVAGGREITFKERQSEIFEAGANAIVIGDYLTTSGEAPTKDKDMIESLGLKLAKTHHG
ncbi:biotin synthase [Sulfurospirillum arcachonense]|uniref:biotin synthase n=1 Tax=Sulfurospirillum arcachonense TaxID=57666 RepID=UPI00046A8A49|nr:biotin synthase [Sulfurospirillum arcachonense]